MDKEKAKYIASIIELIILFMIASYLVTKYTAKYFIKDLEDNYSENRNNPLIAFTSSFFGKNTKFSQNGKSGFTNFINSKIKSVFKTFLSFLKPVFSIINSIFGQLQDNLNKLRSLLKPIRDFFNQITQQFYKTIESSMLLVTYSLNKIRNAMRRSLSGFNLIFHTLEHSRNAVQSIIKSPPVKLAINLIPPMEWMNTQSECLFCFGPEVIIKLFNNNKKLFKDLNFSDKLNDGSLIVSLQCFKNKDYLYYFNGIYVSGFHKIKENNNWINVKDSRLFKLSNYKPNYVYCITTTSSKIIINNLVFKDYSESNNRILNYQINSLILDTLNSKQIYQDVSYPSNYLEHGLHPTTYIHTESGPKKIIDIQIGDKLLHEDEVIGKVIINPLFFNYYIFNNMILTSNYKVLDYNIWKNIEKVNKIETKIADIYAVNIVTKSGLIDTVYGDKMIDYLEIKDNFVNKNIDDLIKKYK